MCNGETDESRTAFYESVADFVPIFPLFNQITSTYFFHVSSAGSSECKHVLLN